MKRTVFLSCVVLLALFVIARSDVLAQEHCFVGKVVDFVDGDTGEELSKEGRLVTNYALITWKEMKNGSPPLEDVPYCALGFFYAAARAENSSDADTYEFIMIVISDSAKESFGGKFNIYQGGNLIHENCSGVFSLDLEADSKGSVFKFEINDSFCSKSRENWQFNVEIIGSRVDLP